MPRNEFVSILGVIAGNGAAVDLSRALASFEPRMRTQWQALDAAYQTAVDLRPDLALVELGSAQADGDITLANRLRNDLGIPIVFFTLRPDPASIQRAADCEALGYLAPPFTEPVVRATLELALRQSKNIAQLKFNETRYRTLYESMVQGVIIFDARFKLLAANPAACHIFNLSAEQLIGAAPNRKISFSDESGAPLPFRLTPFAVVKKTGRPIENVILQMCETSSETTRWVRVSVFPQFRTAAAEPFQIIAIMDDITEARKTTQALQESEKNYRLLAENASDVIWQLDIRTMRFTYISPSIYRLRGMSVEEALNEKLEDSLDAEGVEKARAILTERVRGYYAGNREPTGQTNLFRQPHKNGGWVWVDIVTNLVPDESGEPRYVLGVSRSADAQVRARQELLASQKRYQALFEQVMDAVIVNEVTADEQPGKIVEVNTAACALYGWSREELIGQNISLVFPLVDRDLATPIPNLSDLLAGRDVILETEVIARGGRSFTAEVFARLLEYNDKPAIMVVSRDISLRKQAENRIQQLNVTLEKRVSERTAELQNALKELETFAYSVSHDLKTPLRAIDGFSQILLEDYSAELDEDGQNYLRRIRRNTVHMGQLIDDLLAYARLERRDLVLGPVSLGKLINKLLAENQEEIALNGTTVRVLLEVDEITAEAEGVDQSLRNLLQNALKFSARRPNPSIEIGSSAMPGGVRVWVKDNGIGFDMIYHNQIFEIFKRLHRGDEYPGTGVGLALVRKSMQRVGGNTWAVSKAGEGATFYLDFPA